MKGIQFLTEEELRMIAKKNPELLKGQFVKTKDGMVGMILRVSENGLTVVPISWAHTKEMRCN